MAPAKTRLTKALRVMLTVLPAVFLSAADAPRRISDNSFLIEEAYNQERRVVQHIFTFMYDYLNHSWNASFSQEWPAFGP